MNCEPLYLLGTGECYPNSWNRHYIAFAPANDSSEANLSVEDGFFPHDCGGVFTTAEALNKPFVLERIRELGLSWFIPYLERMAAGERFTADQMQRLYFDHMGRYMEVSVGGHFSFMERPKELK